MGTTEGGMEHFIRFLAVPVPDCKEPMQTPRTHHPMRIPMGAPLGLGGWGGWGWQMPLVLSTMQRT